MRIIDLRKSGKPDLRRERVAKSSGAGLSQMRGLPRTGVRDPSPDFEASHFRHLLPQREGKERYFLAAAARSTKVLPPFILW